MKRLLLTLSLLIFADVAFSQEDVSRVSKLEQAARPGAPHQRLSAFVGQWKVKAKIWVSPGSNPEVFSARANINYILSKRFVEQELTSRTLTKKYNMLSIVGYDNSIARYTSVWLSNYHTGIISLLGDYVESNKTYTFQGSIVSPVDEDVDQERGELSADYLERDIRIIIKQESKQRFRIEHQISSAKGKNDFRTVSIFSYTSLEDNI